MGHGLAAREASDIPEVDQHDLAGLLRKGESRAVQQRDLKIPCRLTDPQALLDIRQQRLEARNFPQGSEFIALQRIELGEFPFLDRFFDPIQGLVVFFKPEIGVGDLETVPGRLPVADLPAQLLDLESGLKRFPEGAGFQEKKMLVVEDFVLEFELIGETAGLFGQRPDPLQGLGILARVTEVLGVFKEFTDLVFGRLAAEAGMSQDGKKSKNNCT